MKTTLRRAVVISLLTLLVGAAILWALPFLGLIVKQMTIVARLPEVVALNFSKDWKRKRILPKVGDSILSEPTLMLQPDCI